MKPLFNLLVMAVAYVMAVIVVIVDIAINLSIMALATFLVFLDVCIARIGRRS